MRTYAVRDAARKYLAAGLAPMPIRKRTPTKKHWPTYVATESAIDRDFESDGNIALILGPSNLADIDLDCDEAVALAPGFLPSPEGGTTKSGRDTRPDSHYWYRVTTPPAYERFKDDRTMMLELRTGAHYTIVYPSVHPDGDTYRWNGGGEMNEELRFPSIDATQLVSAVRLLAAATLLARHFPTEPGSRHDIVNALSGMLLRGGFGHEETIDFITKLTAYVDPVQASTHIASARVTVKNLLAGKPVTAATALKKLLGDRVVDNVSPNPKKATRPKCVVTAMGQEFRA